MGLADWLAKRKLTYRDLDQIDQLFENMGYYCTHASMKLAQERSPYSAFNGSEWSKGNLIGAKPLQWFLEHGRDPQRWQKLSEDVQTYGIRNSHNPNRLVAKNTRTRATKVSTSGFWSRAPRSPPVMAATTPRMELVVDRPPI